MIIIKMVKFPLILLLISIFLNCNQTKDANSKDSGSSSNQNKMLSRLLNQKNGPNNEKGMADHEKDLLENLFYENNKMKEYRLKLSNKVLLETTSKTISLPEESIACTVTGTMKITTTVDLTILTSTDTYNKSAELSNEKKTVVFDNCSNDEYMTIKSGTMVHTQTTKSKLSIATASNILTETITEGVESIEGSKEAGVAPPVISLRNSSSVKPTANFAATFAIGKPVALEAKADERDTRGFISITIMRPSCGFTENCTLEPPVSTPISRNTARDALRMI
jgi:hypothetical protein